MELSQKQKTFSEFFFLPFENIYQIWKIFQKKATLTADVFPKFGPTKNVFR